MSIENDLKKEFLKDFFSLVEMIGIEGVLAVLVASTDDPEKKFVLWCIERVALTKSTVLKMDKEKLAEFSNIPIESVEKALIQMEEGNLIKKIENGYEVISSDLKDI